MHRFSEKYNIFMKLTLKWSHSILLAVVALAMTLAGRTDAANQQVCTQDEEKHALNEADSLKDWNAVYLSFKSFAHCDDGAIAEGYSDTVGRLLASDWQHVSLLYRLTATDSAFKRFVLRHIDETIPDGKLKTIATNAKLHCPPGKTVFCSLIAARAQPRILK